MARKVRIGTRGSKLALWQAGWVKERIEKGPVTAKAEIVKIKTTGDKIQDVALAKVGGKGLFVKEIEEALLDRRIDVAVHSAKDVPTKLADSLHIAAITEREDPRDVLISDRWKSFNELPREAKVGTSSLRRQAQLLHVRPDLKMMILRGNLDTRLRKLKEDGLDAIIVAASGVIRLGEERQITQYLDFDLCLPATGQGSLALECREEDLEINEILKPLNSPQVSLAVRAERAFLEKLEGGCQVPIAAYGELKDGALVLKGLIARVDGKESIRDEISDDPRNPEAIGRTLAGRLLDSGGKAILEEIYGALLQAPNPS